MRKFWLLMGAGMALAGPAMTGTALGGTPPKDRLAEGRALIEDKDAAARARGFSMLKAAYADPGSRRQAAVGLGVAYMFGKGVDQDLKRGVGLLEEAGDQVDHDAKAGLLLGLTYQNGWGGRAKDPARSLRYFRTCADLGDGRCEWNLGMAYLAGEAVKKDEAEAYRWVRKAAEAGDVQGELSLGVMLAIGQGVTMDGKESRAWYQKAAEQGSSHALRELGGMYLRGEGGLADEATGFAYIELAADTGDQTAAKMMAQLDMPPGPAARNMLDSIKSDWIKAHGQPWKDY